MSKRKPTDQPITLADVEPGNIAETPAGWLIVNGHVNGGWALCDLWDPTQQRKVSATFGVSGEVAVLSVKRKPGAAPATAGGVGCEVDPVRG